MEISGVRVYAHWLARVLVIGGLILFGALERPAETIAARIAYFGVILVHECGHMVAAQRKDMKFSQLSFIRSTALCDFRLRGLATMTR